MNKKALVSILVVIAIILIVIGFYKSYQANNSGSQLPVENPVENPEKFTVSAVNVKHQYKTNRHIVVGEFDLPTPCHILTQSVTKSSDGKTATVAFEATSNAEFCAQVITTRRFKVEIDGARDMVIVATFNGEPLTLNVFEAAANEDLDAFEIEIKG